MFFDSSFCGHMHHKRRRCPKKRTTLVECFDGRCNDVQTFGTSCPRKRSCGCRKRHRRHGWDGWMDD